MAFVHSPSQARYRRRFVPIIPQISTTAHRRHPSFPPARGQIFEPSFGHFADGRPFICGDFDSMPEEGAYGILPLYVQPPPANPFVGEGPGQRGGCGRCNGRTNCWAAWPEPPSATAWAAPPRSGAPR
ncbi:hypothetical protein HMPREF0262_02151 [Clostridium sp. ATCC 29733]|nr:hypothetical protein HMPREF0262_02151 [Clostridium sp. ATCC 29733]